MILALQIALSFIIGALAAALQSLVAERVPLKWRGVILTVPSTMGVGFFFIGLIKGVADVREVAVIFPAALGADYIFVLTYALLVRYGPLVSFPAGIFSFFAIAALILFFPPATFFKSAVWGFAIIIASYLIISRLPQSHDLKKYPMNAQHILGRGVIGGTIASMTVFLSKTLGNVWGGIFSAFPANFSSTLLIYTVLQGKHVIASVGKSLFFPGSINFMIYAFSAMYAFPAFGIWIGTLICYGTSISFAVLYAHIFDFSPKTVPEATPN